MPSSIYPCGQQLSRRRVVVGLAGLALTAAGVGCASGKTLPTVKTPTKTSVSVKTTPTAAVSPTAGTTLYAYSGHNGPVYGVDWSPDGKRIAASSFDGTTHVFEALTGRLAYTYSGQINGIVYAVACSPDGRSIVSAGEDMTAQVWDAPTGKSILTYRGHSDRVNNVAWSLDSRRIASASGGEQTLTTTDNTVRVWLP